MGCTTTGCRTTASLQAGTRRRGLRGNLFCREQLGFDEDALGEQLDAWWGGERARGASTITMQTARNLLLWPGRDVVRKAIEAWLTPQIALLWPKRRVLEVYLNSVEFGPGIYGAEAAARQYFHRSAAELSTDQALRLAVILPSPLKWSAVRPALRPGTHQGHPAPHRTDRAAAGLHAIAAFRSVQLAKKSV